MSYLPICMIEAVIYFSRFYISIYISKNEISVKETSRKKMNYQIFLPIHCSANLKQTSEGCFKTSHYSNKNGRGYGRKTYV